MQSTSVGYQKFITYGLQGYWKGVAAIKKLAQAGKVSEDVARTWLVKQALWQVYLPALKYIPGPKFDVPVPNEVHQADLLYLPHDRPPLSRKTFNYALTVVDVASRYKDAEPLTTKEATEVATVLKRTYKRGPLNWPKLLQVDPGRDFMGAVNQLLSKHKVEVRRGRVDIHRDQAIVESFNRTLAERLFGHQYEVEMHLPSGQRSTEWVARLPAVISALNKEVTRLTGKKPAEAIKKKTVSAKPYPGCQRFLAARFVTCRPKAGRCRPRPTNERRSREKTSGEERFDLLFSLNFDHSYRITFKPITANISYCDHMHQHVKIRQI